MLGLASVPSVPPLLSNAIIRAFFDAPQMKMKAVADHPNRYIREAIAYALNNGWTLRKSGPRAHAWGLLYCPQADRTVASGLSTRPQGAQRIMPRTFDVLLIAVRIKATAPCIFTGIEPCTNMILR